VKRGKFKEGESRSEKKYSLSRHWGDGRISSAEKDYEVKASYYPNPKKKVQKSMMTTVSRNSKDT